MDKLDFAQGALIVENCSRTYGKRVDLLYDQVVKNMENISAKNTKTRNRKRQTALTDEGNALVEACREEEGEDNINRFWCFVDLGQVVPIS